MSKVSSGTSKRSSAIALAVLLAGCGAAPVTPAHTAARPVAAEAAEAPEASATASAEASPDTSGPEAAPSRGLDATEQQIAAYIDEHDDEALAFLERAVAINSGTMNFAGVREVGDLFARELEALGFETRWIDQDQVNRAGHLIAERAGSQGKRVLLIGHLDTVFEKDSPFQRFERISDDEARGPGVADMKGGNVVILYALKALHSVGALDDTRIIVVFTGDEEMAGKPTEISRKDLIDAAKRSDAALGFEQGIGGPNTATVARRGSSSWTLRVTARPGHSSGIFAKGQGAGAIYEAARILNAFYDELREDNLTFSPGMIVGGTAVEHDPAEHRGAAFGKNNVIARTVIATGDLRALTVAQRERAKQRMREIIGRSLPHAEAEIEFRDGYPPMAPTAGNQALFDELDRVSRDLGLGPVEVIEPGRRGAADISFVAPYVDSLAGLGVIGEGSHSPEETLELGSLPVVTKRAAVFLYRLTRE